MIHEVGTSPPPPTPSPACGGGGVSARKAPLHRTGEDVGEADTRAAQRLGRGLLGGGDDDLPLASIFISPRPCGIVEQVLQTGALKDRTWIVQDHTYVVADEVYYCRTKQPRKVKTDYLLDLMGVPNRRGEFNERVFLTRGAAAARHIVNMDEVEAVLHDHQFRVVEVAGWPIEQQIDLFSKTRYLVGIHGAGFTNIMFRRDAPLSLLELHSESYRSRDFEDLCEQYGYWWDHLGGRPDDASRGQHANFSLDPSSLDRKIREMLSA